MKECIWCLKNEQETTFKQRAHIVPDSLGAKKITKFECDVCNQYFGRSSKGDPSVDLVFKEAFNITRTILLSMSTQPAPKFSSTYFKLDKNKFSITTAFKLKKGFQQTLCKQFKKGLFKIALEFLIEEIEFGFENEFDSIRNFVRHDGPQLPVFYYSRNYGMIITADKITRNPILLPLPNWKQILLSTKFFWFEILYHRFVIPIGSNFDASRIPDPPERIFNEAKSIEFLTDIDLMLDVIRKG